jgi:DNA-directed RNA polymerase subunit H (RpoH/RPB5)
MSLTSNRILTIYKSRYTVISQLESLEYDVKNYSQFSINEIDAMYSNNQLDMLVSNPKTNIKVYVKFLLNIKQLRKDNLDEIIEDLFDIENILEKKDVLLIVTNDEPNDTIIQKLKYLYDHSGIFVVIQSLKRLQFNILLHELVPYARSIADDELQSIKLKYNIASNSQFPEISRFDPQALALCLRPNEVIMITRKSNTALKYKYYRVSV